MNHLEGHIVSALALPKSKIKNQKAKISFPALALIVSGGHTQLILMSAFSPYPLSLSPKYQPLADTLDDALGEALDKAARMLGLGYPGGAVLEKLARKGNPSAYKLTLPLLGRENQGHFSYSGLKTAFYRLTNGKSFTKQEICDLAASFQNIAFEHLIRIVTKSIVIPGLTRNLYKSQFKDFLIGGGVAANVELRKRLRKFGRESGFKVHFPYSKKLCTDNAAMIGLAAQFAFNRGEAVISVDEIDAVDRHPNLNFPS